MQKSSPLRPLKIAFVLIVCTVFLFCIGGLFFPTYWSQPELRWLAPIPSIDDPHSLDTYVRDHFGIRGALVWIANVTSLFLYHNTRDAHVIVGDDSWLFFHDIPDGATTPFTDAQLHTWREYLEERTAWFRRHGIQFIFIIVPDKQTIYPEHLRRVSVENMYPRRTQLMAYLGRSQNLPIIDATETLREAKIEAGDGLYYQYGTHWTSVGAFVFYQSLAAVIPSFLSPKLSESDVRKESAHAADDRLYQMFFLHASPESDQVLEYTVKNPAVRTIASMPGIMPNTETTIMSTGKSGLPRALVYHDSFFKALMPFISENFSTVKYVRNGTYAMSKEDVDQMQPVLVIQEIVERKLGNAPPVLDDWMKESR